MLAEMDDRYTYYAKGRNYLKLPQETINELVEVIPNITITLEKDTDKLSPKKSMEKIKFN